MDIRQERPEDAAPIRAVTEAAFKGVPFSDQTEGSIIDALRSAGVLTVSLVATEGSEILGHVAFSPVHIDGAAGSWYGLGPVAVLPERQREGIGQRLVRDGLDRLERLKAQGCVVLGDPTYYGRFGFGSDPALFYAEVPPGYFQRLVFEGAAPTGEVKYHPAFDVS
jgi:putative acetyltransferase